jgi:hypothetical protein
MTYKQNKTIEIVQKEKKTTEQELGRLIRVVRWPMVKQRAVHMQVHNRTRQTSTMVSSMFQHDDVEMLYPGRGKVSTVANIV